MSAVRDAIHRIRLATDVRLSDALVVEDALLTAEEAQELIASAPAYLSAGLYAKLKRIAGDS